jgi:hypothetical protein
MPNRRGRTLWKSAASSVASGTGGPGGALHGRCRSGAGIVATDERADVSASPVVLVCDEPDVDVMLTLDKRMTIVLFTEA